MKYLGKLECCSGMLMCCFRFTTPHHKEGFELFLDTVAEMEDVWLVTSWQVRSTFAQRFCKHKL